MGRLRGLAQKAMRRLSGVQQGVGPAFGSAQDAAFAQMNHEAEGAFQLVGAAVVGTWEVGITDIGRALDGRIPESDRMVLVERISDGLVPIQQPLQQAGHKFRHALQEGVKAALKSHRLCDATDPMVAVLQGIAGPTDEGWVKTTDYLDPVFAVLPGTEAVKTRFRDGGPALAAIFDAQAHRFSEDMAALPQATDLKVALADAMDRWREGTVAGIEQAIYDCRTAVVEAATQLDRI